MDDLSVSPTSTADAALAARDRVAALAPSIGRDERVSAKLAQAALFDEALLGALKARFAELRLVTK